VRESEQREEGDYFWAGCFASFLILYRANTLGGDLSRYTGGGSLTLEGLQAGHSPLRQMR
jgi:hypothetical protein